MSTIQGTYRGGRVDLDAPVDWPDGLRVEVVDPARPWIGRAEEEWPDTPEGREALLARFDAIEPLEFTPEEEAEFDKKFDALTAEIEAQIRPLLTPAQLQRLEALGPEQVLFGLSE